MTPVCANCLYFRTRDGECHNPDCEKHYAGNDDHVPTFLTNKCEFWEYEYEFKVKKGEYEPWVKRVTHSGRRKLPELPERSRKNN